jgi:carboxymethylenebutenolidase
MIDQHVDLATADGAMNTFITHPEEGGPHPVVLFLMDAPGKREELHDMARRIGTAGYYVILPNLYYRRTREFNVFSGKPDQTREQLVGHMGSLDFTTLATDVGAVLAHVDADPAADAERIGVVGYCMSGPFAYATAGLFPDRIQAAASFYGVNLSGDTSPAQFADQITGELYFGCAELDEYAPPEMIAGLERELAATSVRHRVEWYPGTHHGFAFPSREGAFDRDACERHYERVFSLFDRTLRS